MMKVLHCFNDEIHSVNCIRVLQKYDDQVEQIFLHVGSSQQQYKRLKDVFDKIVFIERDNFIYYVNNNGFDAVFIHNITTVPITVLYKVDKNIKIFWFSWGFDIYSPIAHKPFVKLNLYKRLTRKNISKNLIHHLRVIHGFLNRWSKRKYIYKSISRIDYYSGVLPIEYDLMSTNKFFKAKQVDFSYINGRSTLESDNLQIYDNLKTSVLLGNSGDPTNNHLDAMALLHKTGYSGEIYAFLSYGGTADYVTKVKNGGMKMFGSRFHPITDFLSFEDFNQIIQTCGNMIMYHERQQAMGNIYQGLLNGCKVYLSETSVTYKYLKSVGYIVFSMQKDLDLYNLTSMLTVEQVSHNRQLLNRFVSIEAAYKKIDVIYRMI